MIFMARYNDTKRFEKNDFFLYYEIMLTKLTQKKIKQIHNNLFKKLQYFQTCSKANHQQAR